MDLESKSNVHVGGDDSGYFSNVPDDSGEEDIPPQPEVENINLSEFSPIDKDEDFLEAIFNDAVEKVITESLHVDLSVSAMKPPLPDSKNSCEDGSTKQKLQRKKSRRDNDKEYDEKTTAAIDALFHLLLFHDNCDVFCSKAEETWFWGKSVPEVKFLTAKSWFKELVLYFRSFQFHLPVIIALVKGKREVELRIPSSINMEIQFPSDLFQTGHIGQNSDDSEVHDRDESPVLLSAEKLKESNECIYICESRLRKLEISVKRLLSKFEALLILSSPVGHQYNNTSFLARKRFNDASLKDPFDDPITLI